MAPARDAYATNALRAASYRISSVPPKQLPAVIPQITALLVPCRPILSSSYNSAAKDASESSVLVHKFRTQITTLLQDKSAEGQWSAVVLCKTAIELGGWEMLQKCGPWVRGLLAILTKRDHPSTTKVMAIVTLTRIFMLTRDYQTLVREITTPSLTPFITSCLNLLGRPLPGETTSPQLVEAILESFSRLLPRHPTTFRPHLGKINNFLAYVVASAQAMHLTATGLVAARNLFAQLPCCAAKGASKEEWEKSLLNVVSAAHHTASKVFRSVLEDWESVTGVPSPNAPSQAAGREVQAENDVCGFPGWCGIYAGGQRLVGLLQLLSEMTCNPTAYTTPVNYRIAHIMDLITRVLSVTAPASRSQKHEGGMAYNDQIGKEERNTLWTILPEIHVAAIGLVEAVLERFGQSMAPLMEFLLERLVFLFQEEQLLPSIRSAVYSIIAQILPILGDGLQPSQVKSLNGIVHACCDDLLPRKKSDSTQPPSAAVKNGNKNAAQGSLNADSFLKTPQTTVSETTVPNGVLSSASALLPNLLLRLPADTVVQTVRSRMDQVALLTKHEQALISSCLNGAGTSMSLVPLLARLYSSRPEVEAFLRPRVPAIKTTNSSILDSDADIEDGEESEDDAEIQAEQGVEGIEAPKGSADNMEVDATPVQTKQTKKEEAQLQAADLVEKVKFEHLNGSTEVENDPVQEGPEKRQSEDVEAEAQAPSPKRARISSPLEVPSREKASIQMDKATEASTEILEDANYEMEEPEDDDDDEDVEIPSLVMGDDDEDDEEE